MYKIKRYFKGVFKQGSMVRWPKGKELLGYFSIVMSVIVFSAVSCSVFDFVIAKILGTLEANLGSSTSSVSESVDAAMRMIWTFLGK